MEICDAEAEAHRRKGVLEGLGYKNVSIVTLEAGPDDVPAFWQPQGCVIDIHNGASNELYLVVGELG
jgi:hypothetical protein